MADRHSEENSIRIFFSDKEWSKLGMLEKRRFFNLKRNYEVLKSTGLNPRVPEFMNLKKKKKADVCSTAINQEKLKPKTLKATSNKGTNVGASCSKVLKEKGSCSKPYDPNEFQDLMKLVKEVKNTEDGDTMASEKNNLLDELVEKMCQVDWKTCTEKYNQKSKGQISILLARAEFQVTRFEARSIAREQNKLVKESEPKSEPRRRYPKRNVPKVCYTEEDLSSDDELLYCEDCGKAYDGSCPVHGPMIRVPDRKVPPGYHADRAKQTCPSVFSVCRSGIRGAGLGVWTERPLPKGVVFGPYDGKIVKRLKEAETSGYAWEIRKGGRVLHYIEGSDMSESNWLRFVNCAQYEEQQNLVAFQYRGQIFYRTYKAVLAYTELFVWYGDEYASELGIGTHEEEEEDPEEKSKNGIRYAIRRTSSYAPRPRKSLNVGKNGGRKTTPFTTEPLGEHYRLAPKKKYASFSEKDLFPIAELSNTREKTFTCAHCYKKFNAVWRLALHKKTHMETEKNSSTTSEGVKNRDIMRSDQRCIIRATGNGNSSTKDSPVPVVTSEEEPQECQLSEHRAVESDILVNNATGNHTKQKPHKCQHCDYRSARRGDLQRHVSAVHLGEKPHKCQHCDYRAARLGDLKKHVTAVHMRKKPQ